MRYILIIFIAIAFLNVCSHNHKHVEKTTVQSDSISLDNNKRWKTDDPTRIGFTKLKSDYDKLSKSKKIKYNDASVELNKDIQAIFKACKMTGQGHDELHKFIEKLMNSLNQMKSKDESTAKSAFLQFGKDLATYSDYFE